VLFILAWLALRACGLAFDRASLPGFITQESAPLVWSVHIAWQLAYLATVATVAVFFLWTWGQARSTATHAAVIFSLEPVFANAFAVAFRGGQEWLNARGYAGAGLVLAGVFVSELRWSRKRKGEQNDE
jgi:drug/metabolite transporter (DMT)-like permease